MNPIPKYITTLSRSLNGLLELFYIDFLVTFLVPYRGEPRFLVVCVEKLTNCTIVRATNDATAQTVIKFKEDESFHTYGEPTVVVSDNAGFLTARSSVHFMENTVVHWIPVADYAPMSNKNAERMFGIIMKGIGLLIQENRQNWPEHYNKAIQCYRFGPFSLGKTPSELLNGVPPSLSKGDVASNRAKNGRDSSVELLALYAVRETRAVVTSESR